MYFRNMHGRPSVKKITKSTLTKQIDRNSLFVKIIS